MTSKNVNHLALAATFAGLLGGTTARLNAQPVSGHSETTTISSAFAGVMDATDQRDFPKHACKRQNEQGLGFLRGLGSVRCASVLPFALVLAGMLFVTAALTLAVLSGGSPRADRSPASSGGGRRAARVGACRRFRSETSDTT